MAGELLEVMFLEEEYQENIEALERLEYEMELQLKEEKNDQRN